MVAYIRPQQWKEEESERLRGEGDQIKLLDLRFERGKVVALSEFCWGKAIVAYTRSQQWKKEENERLRGERGGSDQVY